MKRRLLNLINVFVVSCYIAGCTVKTPDVIKNDPAVSGTVSATAEITGSAATTEARGHFEYKPVVISSIFREIMGEDMYEAYCNYVTAVQKGEDSFKVKSEEAYDWMIGQFPSQLQPVYFDYTESNYGGAFKNGSATFQYKISKEDLAAKEKEFEKLVTDILNENLRDDYSDFEKALALYLYIANNCSYDYDLLQKLDKDPSLKASPYRFLTTKSGICSECSTAYSFLLLQAGVDATIAGGTGSDNEAHGWSYVTIKGKNYHIDPTYAMGSGNSLSYFMMSDSRREKENGFQKKETTIGCHYKGNHNGNKYDADDGFFKPLWGGTLTSWDHEKKLIHYTDANGENAVFDYSSVG